MRRSPSSGTAVMKWVDPGVLLGHLVDLDLTSEVPLPLEPWPHLKYTQAHAGGRERKASDLH